MKKISKKGQNTWVMHEIKKTIESKSAEYKNETIKYIGKNISFCISKKYSTSSDILIFLKK